MSASGDVQIVIDGEALSPLAVRVISYSYRTAVDRVPNTGEIVLSPLTDPEVRNVLNRLTVARQVQVVVGRTVVSTSRIAGKILRAGGAGSVPEAAVMLVDLLGQPFKSDARPGYSPAGLTVLQAVESLLQPWGLTVRPTNEANRQITSTRMVERTVPFWQAYRTSEERAAAVHAQAVSRGDGLAAAAVTTARALSLAGSTVRVRAYEELLAAAAETSVVVRSSRVENRHLVPRTGTPIATWLPEYLREAGLMVMAGATGDVVLFSPDYDSAPSMRVTYHPEGPMDGGIISSESNDDTPSQVTSAQVSGRTGKRGETKIQATATDDDLIEQGVRIERYFSERDARSIDAARAKAEQHLREAQLASWSYTCRVSGHGIGLALQAADTMVDVQDVAIGIEQLLYCKAVEFELPTGGAPSATMHLCLPGLWGAGAYAVAQEEKAQ